MAQRFAARELANSPVANQNSDEVAVASMIVDVIERGMADTVVMVRETIQEVGQ